MVPRMETLQVAQGGGVTTVTLARPERKNAINDVMWRELREVLEGIAADPSVRCVVLTGAGGAFCSGADLSGAADVTEERPHQLGVMRGINLVVRALHDLPQPTIAKVDGVAVGAGFSLALGCDLMVATPESRFSAIFARRSLTVDCGLSWLLPRAVGRQKAKELALFADIITAADAADLGFLNRVVPAEEIDAFVDDWAARLAAGPPIALAMTKRAVDRAFESTFQEALDTEALTQTVNFATADTLEAMTAFIEKRDPTFRGR